MVFVCQCRKKKPTLTVNGGGNQHKTSANTPDTNPSFKVLPKDNGVVALFPKIRLDEDSSTLGDSSFVSSSNDIGGRLPQHHIGPDGVIVPSFSMRYLTGSSTNVTDSTLVVPFINPPPTIASLTDDAGLSMTSLNDIGEGDDVDEGMSEMTDLTMSYIPAPPATPLYCPSEVESCMTTDLELDMDSVSTRGEQPPCMPSHSEQQQTLCKHCKQQQQNSHHQIDNQLYMNNRMLVRANSNSRHPCTCGDFSSGLSSTYTNSMDRRLVPPRCNSCSYCNRGPVSPRTDHNPLYATMGRTKPPSSYHPPSLVSEPSSYTSRTLPKHLRNGPTRPLVPSLASGVSRCSSEASIITVRNKNGADDLPPPYSLGIDVAGGGCGGGATDSDIDTGEFYNSYGPPPSPGVLPSPLAGFPPDMNNFEDFKDEEEEALENDLLLESHRPNLASVD